MCRHPLYTARAPHSLSLAVLAHGPLCQVLVMGSSTSRSTLCNTSCSRNTDQFWKHGAWSQVVYPPASTTWSLEFSDK
jgi:hypothetical protein